ncbi:siderophore-interacting protein [Dyella sp.]|uniref:siderophore-interacting protein n=1 Tax=Dyella sp. TaxID=1869338 RepID=UPI002ED6BD4C
MTVQGASTPSTRPQGRLSRALIRMLMKQASIVAVDDIAADFRLLTLTSPQFMGLSWAPGQKIQVAMGSAFAARTFTPIEWNAVTGQTRILGYVHGEGPGGAWIRDASPGDTCDVFGPRASLDAGRASKLVVLGDETSIGLAYALTHRTPGAAVPCLFEVNHAGRSGEVLARLGMTKGKLFERKHDDTHLLDIEQCLPSLATGEATFVLTGKAATIQRLRRALKTLGVPSSRLLAKPYWAPGKTGLD